MLSHGTKFNYDLASCPSNNGAPFNTVNPQARGWQTMSWQGMNSETGGRTNECASGGKSPPLGADGWNLLDFEGERDNETTDAFNAGCRQVVTSSRSRKRDYSRLNKLEGKRNPGKSKPKLITITDSSTWIDLCESEDIRMVFEGEINGKKDLRGVFQKIYEQARPGLSVLLIDSPEPNAYSGIFAIKDGAYICNAAIEDEYISDYDALKKLVAVEKADYEYFRFVSDEFEIPVPLLKIRLNFLSFVRPDVPDFVSNMIESLELEEVLFAERPEELDLRSLADSHQLSGSHQLEPKLELPVQWKPIPDKSKRRRTSNGMPRYGKGLSIGITSPEEADYTNTARKVKSALNKRRIPVKAVCLALVCASLAYHYLPYLLHQPQVVSVMKNIAMVVKTVR